MPGFYDQSDLAEQLQCTRQLAVGQVVSHLTALACCPYQTAAAKTGEMVGDVCATLTHVISEFSRIGRSIDQPNKDPSTYTVGHRGADTPKRVKPRIEAKIGSHGCDDSSAVTVIHDLLYLSGVLVQAPLCRPVSARTTAPRDHRALALVQQMRPTLTNEHAAQRPPWLSALPHDQTVYVTLGTIWNTDIGLFQLVIDALRDQVNLIVTVGRQNRPELFGPQPAGVIIRSYIPQDELLPWCDAAVVHGGSGTMLGALAHGVRLLVLPQGADQWNNAERVAAAGAGRLLLRDEVTLDAIRNGISTTLGEPTYRNAATRVRDEIWAMPSASEAINRIEALLE